MARKSLQFSSIVALSLFALAAHADCPYPKSPTTIPSGSSASEAEMISAMQAFKAYNEDVKTFQACLDTESKSASGQTMQFKQMQAKKLAAAVEELEQKAKAFNEQVRIFKARAG
jgi:hypothetical protein